MEWYYRCIRFDGGEEEMAASPVLPVIPPGLGRDGHRGGEDEGGGESAAEDGGLGGGVMTKYEVKTYECGSAEAFENGKLVGAHYTDGCNGLHAGCMRTYPVRSQSVTVALREVREFLAKVIPDGSFAGMTNLQADIASAADMIDLFD